MSDIKLITPPDRIYDRAYTVLLVHPSEAIKYQLQEAIRTSNKHYNIYIYDINTDEHYNWLFDVHLTSDITIVELDNLPENLKCIESYLISFPNTYWITQGENPLYNKISSNRIYTLEEVKVHIGDYGEVQ
jgi:hypothetical protein